MKKITKYNTLSIKNDFNRVFIKKTELLRLFFKTIKNHILL